MPELPEVQTVVNNLTTKVINKTILDVTNPNRYQNVFLNSDLALFKKNIINKKIINISRLGKYIIITLDKGFITVHLRMTGKLLFNVNSNKKYITAKFLLNDNNYLVFDDVRKFGKINYLNSLNSLKTKLGIEPLSKNFNVDWLLKNISKKNRMIKALLFDQSFIAGLGNIYIDECLWNAKIHPQSISSKLTKQNILDLHSSIISILKKAIEFQGTTIINFYFGNNSKGNYEENLSVYSRENKHCRRCNNIIIKIFVCQRGTHICKSCQKIRR